MTNTAESIQPETKITCQICLKLCHSIQAHLKECHEDCSIEEYKEKYPLAPLMSELAEKKLKEHLAKKSNKTSMATAAKVVAMSTSNKQPMHELFGLRKSAKTLRKSGDPIMITTNPKHDFQDMVPEVDDNYVYPVDTLKIALMGLEMNIPTYLWGHSGIGKSSIWEQIFSRTNWPSIRVQHTGSTEESHILGSMSANENGTYFEPGPLPLAMRHGWAYLADEYDFAFPQVMAVYQSVLEGKPLIIKEAPPEWRQVKPHPNFRIIATGNTNGAGDESGLYQGTNVQNAANFERFGIVEQVPYMDAREEKKIVMKQAKLKDEHASKVIEFAKLIRTAYDGRKIGYTIGPRVLINIGKLWIARGSAACGVKLAFTNRLPETDRQVVNDLAQRVFG